MRTDLRPQYLGWIETSLRADNPDLRDLYISAQSHYDPDPGLAFIEVHGVRHDPERRRKLRLDASELLQRLGCRVLLEPGRDVYQVRTDRPASAHECFQVLRDLRATLVERDAPPE